MCIAIYSPSGITPPNEDILKMCWKNNSHGAGVAFVVNNKVIIHKGFMTYDDFITKYNNLNHNVNFADVPLFIHFRISTMNNKVHTSSMTHPFPISNNIGVLSMPYVSTDYAVMHNGTIYMCKSKADRQDISDTAYFIQNYLYKIAQNQDWFNVESNIELISQLVDSKMAIMDKNGVVKLIGDWEEFEGNFYSNQTYKEPRTPKQNVNLVPISSNNEYLELMKLTYNQIVIDKSDVRYVYECDSLFVDSDWNLYEEQYDVMYDEDTGEIVDTCKYMLCIAYHVMVYNFDNFDTPIEWKCNYIDYSSVPF